MWLEESSIIEKSLFKQVFFVCSHEPIQKWFSSEVRIPLKNAIRNNLTDNPLLIIVDP